MKVKIKKIAILMLALILVASLFAGCGSKPASTPSNPSNPSNPSTPSTPVDKDPVPDGTVYTLRYASQEAEGGPKNLKLEIPLKDMLYEKSGGRIVLEIYSSSTLAEGGEMLEALTSGICDMGILTPPMFQGQFPYADLFSTPGLYYGDIYEMDQVLREYTATYVDEPFKTQVKQCIIKSIGTQAIITTKPINSVEDLKGMTSRITSSSLDFYQALGMVGVSLSAADQYEGLKLGTIDSTITGLSGFKSRKLAEVTSGMIANPVHQGEDRLVISMSCFNSLPADLQAVLEETFAELEASYTQFTVDEDAAAIEDALTINPNFKTYEFSDADIETLVAAGTAGLEAKAAELDAQGLDGTGALQFLRDRAK